MIWTLCAWATATLFEAANWLGHRLRARRRWRRRCNAWKRDLEGTR